MAQERQLGGRRRRGRTRSAAIVGGSSLVAIVGIALGLAWWLGYFDEPPAEATLQDSIAAVQDRSPADSTTAPSDSTTAPSEPSDDATDPVAADDSAISGVWTVVPDESATFAGYRINEVLTTIGDFEVVGRTGDVTGSITIDGSSIVAAELSVDMTTLTTDNDRRDAAMREQALETEQFPIATFVLTEPIDLVEVPVEGTQVAVSAVGDLTVHGVTQRVEFPLDAQIVGDLIVVVGQLDIQLADFDIQAPVAPIVASVDEQGLLELSVALGRSG